MKKEEKNYVVLKKEIFDEQCSADYIDGSNGLSNGLSKLGGRDKTQRYGLEYFEVQFTISANNKEGETRQFIIVFRTVDRNNLLKNYKGSEMCLIDVAGNESDEFLEFLDYSDKAYEFLDELLNKAKLHAKKKLERLLKKL